MATPPPPQLSPRQSAHKARPQSRKPQTNPDDTQAMQSRLTIQGEYLKQLRAAANLTQLEVAKVVGFDEAKMIGHWEAGRLWVGEQHQTKLAEALGLDPGVMAIKLALIRHPGLAHLATRTPDQLIKHAQEGEAVARHVAQLIERSRVAGDGH